MRLAKVKMNSACPEWCHLAEKVGEFMRYWGFKSIHGRIWTILFLAREPLDAARMIERLNVSKALMSISLRELLDYEVILPAGKSAQGTELYRANPEIMKVITNVLRQREKRMLADVATAWQLLEKLPEAERQKQNIANESLTELGSMIDQAQITLDHLIELSEIDLTPWQEFQGSS